MDPLTIPVPEDLRDFVDRRARETQHGSAAGYVQALIREDQERAERERLEAQVKEGLHSGEPMEIAELSEHFGRKKQALIDRMKKANP